jgi:hypothetical protein
VGHVIHHQDGRRGGIGLGWRHHRRDSIVQSSSPAHPGIFKM